MRTFDTCHAQNTYAKFQDNPLKNARVLFKIRHEKYFWRKMRLKFLRYQKHVFSYFTPSKHLCLVDWHSLLCLLFQYSLFSGLLVGFSSLYMVLRSVRGVPVMIAFFFLRQGPHVLGCPLATDCPWKVDLKLLYGLLRYGQVWSGGHASLSTSPRNLVSIAADRDQATQGRT